MKVSEALKLYGKNGPILFRDSIGDVLLYSDLRFDYIDAGSHGKIPQDVLDFELSSGINLLDWFEHPPTATCTIPHACQYDLVTDMCSICGFRQVIQSVSGGEYSVRVTTTTAKTETNNKCTCDFHTVILRTGCQCGGV